MEKPYPEELIRRLSKTVLHASEKGRQSLFFRLTAENAERINQMLLEKPVFHENQEDAPREILLDDEIQGLMPEDFFQDPTGWLESQKNIEREDKKQLPVGEAIDELFYAHYDVSRVKEFVLALGDKRLTVVSKRVGKEKLEEIALSRKAYEAGIPTPRIYGEVIDNGNIYVLFEKLNAISSLHVVNRMENYANNLWQLPSTTVSKEQEFKSRMRESHPGIDSVLEKKLLTLWRKYQPIIEIQEGLLVFAGAAYSLDELKRDIVEGEGQPPAFEDSQIEKVLAMLGYKSIDEAIDALAKPIPERNGGYYISYRDFELYKQQREKLKDMRNKWRTIVLKHVVGIDIYEMEEKLMKLCDKKGIQHKDFAPRNILIPWDYATDKADLTQPHTAYLIDWEPKPKTPKEKR